MPSVLSPLAGSTVNASASTRILLLSDFSPELKTRDLMALFADYEDDRGGFKLKWIDETSCWAVFADGMVAKRAFLQLLTSPPTSFTPTATSTPRVSPYSGSDVDSIHAAVLTRPRARSNAGAGNAAAGHRRNGSGLSSYGGSNIQSSSPSSIYGSSTNGAATSGAIPNGNTSHSRNRSHGYGSGSGFSGMNGSYGFGGSPGATAGPSANAGGGGHPRAQHHPTQSLGNASTIVGINSSSSTSARPPQASVESARTSVMVERSLSNTEISSAPRAVSGGVEAASNGSGGAWRSSSAGHGRSVSLAVSRIQE